MVPTRDAFLLAPTVIRESKRHLDHIVRELEWEEERRDFKFKTFHVFFLIRDLASTTKKILTVTKIYTKKLLCQEERRRKAVAIYVLLTTGFLVSAMPSTVGPQ